MAALGKVSGAWKDISQIQAKVSGAWKEVSEGYVKVSGAWNQFFAPAAAGSYELIETEILTTTTSSVTFDVTGLGSDYQHLQIRMTARTNRAATSDFIEVRLNADSGSNYAHRSLFGNGSSVTSAAQTSDDFMDFNRMAAASAAANVFGAIVMDVLDPFETTKNTTIRSLGGFATESINLNSGFYNNTSALTEILITPGIGSSFNSGSRFSIYGIRSA
jgi:hypothetical protein